MSESDARGVDEVLKQMVRLARGRLPWESVLHLLRCGVYMAASPDLSRAPSEVTRIPELVLKEHGADATEWAVLVAALAYELGIECCFRAVKMPGDREFTHVYPMLSNGDGRWLSVPVDHMKMIGWEPDYTEFRDEDVS